jgi:outer membrane protein TolC
MEIKNKTLLGAFLFILTLSTAAVGSAEEVYTWQSAASEAAKHHPDLISAREKWNQTKATKAKTESGLFPQVTADVSAGRSKNETTRARTDTYSYGVSGSQLLFDGLGTFSDVQAAYKNMEAGRYAYHVASSDVRLSLKTAFVQLLRAKELITITESIAKRRLQSRDLIKLRYDAGREHKGSLLTSEANLAQAQLEVDQAKRNLTIAQRRFLASLGRGHWVSVDASGDLNVSALAESKPDLEKLAEETPFLRELIVSKEAAKWGVVTAQSVFFPKVYASASADKTDSKWAPDKRSWSLGVSASMPLFEGGTNIAELNRAQSALRQSVAEETGGRNGVILTLEQAWASMQNAFDNVAVQQKFLDASMTRSQIAESEYSNGLITFNDWIIIEDNLVRTQKNYLDARADAMIAEAAWQQAKGELLDEK